MRAVEKAWLAGIIEGEGSFYTSKRKVKEGFVLHARVEVQMTDEDVIRRIHELTGVGYVMERNKRHSHWKQAWRWGVSGIPALRIMKAILPYMHSRRSERIEEIMREVA